MATLRREFEVLQENTASITWCQKYWWEKESLQFTDWVRVDAWYRSRSLELPAAGHSMVPGLDMANHSAAANAYYEQAPDGTVTLLLRPDIRLDLGSEITISYGNSKTAAEMLFSYGFIDERSTTTGIVLSLVPLPDDPFGKAKLAAFDGPPVVRIFETGGEIKWESPFLYLLCLNEEDGLDFKVLQQNDGSRSQLRMFWQGSDVTEESISFETLIGNHVLKDVFELRAVALLQDRLRSQLERLYETDDDLRSLANVSPVSVDHQKVALQLRSVESAILEAAFNSVDEQVLPQEIS